MKKLTLVLLVCVVLPMQHAVIAQQARFARFANDWCYPWLDDYGWTSIDICRGTNLRRERTDRYRRRVTGVVPRRSRIAYLAGNLYVYDRTTGISALVTDGLPVSGPVSWSRDGAHLAFVRIVRRAFRVDPGTGSDRSGWIEPHATDARRRIRRGLRLVTERQRDRVRPRRWRRAGIVRDGCGRIECDAPYLWGWPPRRHQLVPRR